MFLALTTGQIAGIAVGCVVAVALIGLAVFLLASRLTKKKAERKVEDQVKTSARSIADKFGGRENILEIVQRGSRVVVTVKDPTAVDQKEIEKTVDSVLFMSNKVVLVIGTKSEQFKELLQESVGKTK